MKDVVKKIFSLAGVKLIDERYKKKYNVIYRKYKNFSMLPENQFEENLLIADRIGSEIEGDVVECGVWRGGMIAGLVEVMGKNRTYHLFDSFEGLPPAKDIDGEAAIKWQQEKTGEFYFNNCQAEIEIAESAMKIANCKYVLHKGWFEETLPKFIPDKKLALLRLDGDWFDSIMLSLKYLFPYVSKGGIVLIDDYENWDGCSRAVHSYLSSISSISRISISPLGVCFIIKKDECIYD